MITIDTLCSIDNNAVAMVHASWGLSVKRNTCRHSLYDDHERTYPGVIHLSYGWTPMPIDPGNDFYPLHFCRV